MSPTNAPFQPVAGVSNFRDLGGPHAVVASGGFIRPGFVFRSAEPSGLTDEGETALQDLGIVHVYDLRSRVEIERYSSTIREWPGARRIWAPVFQDVDYSPDAVAVRLSQYSSEGPEGFVEAYRAIWGAGSASFGEILWQLASPNPSPILIHCTAGKDRTGVICAIILSLCGVDDSTIASEYALTKIGLAEWKPKFAASLIKREPALGGSDAAVQRLLGSSMLAALSAMRQQHGSIEQYVVQECGLQPEAVVQLRRNLVSTSPTDQDRKQGA